MQKRSLKEREWFAVCALLMAFLFLSIKAMRIDSSRWPQGEQGPLPKPQVMLVVHLKGEVERPGKYHFPQGTKIGEVIREAGVKEEADLSRMQLDKQIRKGQTVTVPKKKGKRKKTLLQKRE